MHTKLPYVSKKVARIGGFLSTAEVKECTKKREIP